MASELLTERYSEAISGVIESYDRIVISGHLLQNLLAQSTRQVELSVRQTEFEQRLRLLEQPRPEGTRHHKP